jgi:hypothetical protein
MPRLPERRQLNPPIFALSNESRAKNRSAEFESAELLM